MVVVASRGTCINFSKSDRIGVTFAATPERGRFVKVVTKPDADHEAIADLRRTFGLEETQAKPEAEQDSGEVALDGRREHGRHEGEGPLDGIGRDRPLPSRVGRLFPLHLAEPIADVDGGDVGELHASEGSRLDVQSEAIPLGRMPRIPSSAR